MLPQIKSPTNRVASISLVDGDPSMRHARQLMFRAESFDVRAYSNCETLIADRAALASDCIVADVDMGEISGVQLLHAMREKGWNGAAVLLTDTISPQLSITAIIEGFVAMQPKALADLPLLGAVNAAIRGEPAA